MSLWVVCLILTVVTSLTNRSVNTIREHFLTEIPATFCIWTLSWRLFAPHTNHCIVGVNCLLQFQTSYVPHRNWNPGLAISVGMFYHLRRLLTLGGDHMIDLAFVCTTVAINHQCFIDKAIILGSEPRQVKVFSTVYDQPLSGMLIINIKSPLGRNNLLIFD